MRIHRTDLFKGDYQKLPKAAQEKFDKKSFSLQQISIIPLSVSRK